MIICISYTITFLMNSFVLLSSCRLCNRRLSHLYIKLHDNTCTHLHVHAIDIFCNSMIIWTGRKRGIIMIDATYVAVRTSDMVKWSEHDNLYIYSGFNDVRGNHVQRYVKRWSRPSNTISYLKTLKWTLNFVNQLINKIHDTLYLKNIDNDST